MSIAMAILACIFLMLGVPIAFGLGLAVLVAAVFWGDLPAMMIYQQLYQGIDKFTLLAIPLFMLAGELMMRAKIIDDIINLCNVFVGRLRGSLAHVNIVSSMFFAGITGSAVSDTAAIGSILIPSMKKNGYDVDFSVAVTAASSVIGPIIPPSIGMVLYGSVVSVSIGALFAGGMVPGVLLGVGLMVVTAVISRRRRFPISYRRMSLNEQFRTVVRSIPALLMPVIILGGILGGVFTPTEAAAVAVVCALIIGGGFYRTLGLRDVIEALKSSMVMSASILMIVAVANPLGWIVALDQVPQTIAALINSATTDPLLVLLMINFFLLILGSVMEASANILIFAPILAPVAIQVGIDPLHFGIVFVLNLVIGLATPPFGMCLFVGAGIGQIPVESVMKAILPFILVEIAVLLLVTYIPELALWVPRSLGF